MYGNNIWIVTILIMETHVCNPDQEDWCAAATFTLRRQYTYLVVVVVEVTPLLVSAVVGGGGGVVPGGGGTVVVTPGELDTVTPAGRVL